jgi:hypothetical protein
MNKFIVALDVGTRDQRNAVTEIFQKKGWKLWHWMEDLWLLAEVPDKVTSKDISEELDAHPLIGTNKIKIVIRVPGSAESTYWGRGSRDSWEWMSRFWGKSG